MPYLWHVPTVCAAAQADCQIFVGGMICATYFGCVRTLRVPHDPCANDTGRNRKPLSTNNLASANSSGNSIVNILGRWVALEPIATGYVEGEISQEVQFLILSAVKNYYINNVSKAQNESETGPHSWSLGNPPPAPFKPYSGESAVAMQQRLISLIAQRYAKTTKSPEGKASEGY